jgi:uncharacterized membrane protein YphA (DoxX/SURF4 family)
MRRALLSSLLFCAGLLAPAIALAHEVYVLPPEVVASAMSEPGFSEWQTLLTNLNQFILWGCLAVIAVAVVFFVSVSRSLERALDPFLARLPRYAPAISRVAVGLSFLAAAYAGALFGPELPLAADFGAYAPAVRTVLAAIGILIAFGIYARVAALAAIVLFAVEVFAHGTYMLTYANYLGEFVLLLVLGAHSVAFHTARHDRQAPGWLLRLKDRLAPLAMPILRVAFGVALLYASLYAKFIHNNLALAVTVQYPDIVTFFGFEPRFLVLGSAIVEIVIALFFILGIEIRAAALFVLFWLSLSLWYFGEVVWPHIVLIGIPIAFICYGYDRYSLEGYFFKKGKREPVL